MMDSLLMMTIFRDELNLHFAGLFAIFLLAKTFHWLCQDRVDYVHIIIQLHRSFLNSFNKHPNSRSFPMRESFP